MRFLLAACVAGALLGVLPAHAQDERAAAAELMTRAGAALAQGTPASRHEAINLYEQAQLAWQKLGDTSHQVEVDIDLATAHFFLNQKDQSAALLDAALELAQRSGTLSDQASVFSALATFRNVTGQTPQAREAAAAAADVYHTLAQPQNEARMRLALGFFDTTLKNNEAVIADTEAAAALFHQAGDARGEGAAWAAAARAHNSRNEAGGFRVAAAEFTRAIPLLDPTADAFERANAYWGLGLAQDRLGDASAARDAYQQALPFFAQPKFQSVHARIILSLAEDEQTLGRFDKAEDDFVQALALFSPAEYASIGLADMKLGVVREHRGDAAGALTAYAAAAAAWHDAGNAVSEATAELAIGLLQQAAKNWAAAEAANQAALKLSEIAGDRRGQAAALIGLADVDEAQGANSGALAHAEQAMKLLDPQANADRFSALNAAGLAAGNLHQTRKALDYLDQAIAIATKNPADTAGPLTTKAGILVDIGQATDAIKLLEQARDLYRADHNEAMLNKLENDFGLAYAALGRTHDAEAAFTRALAAARQVGRAQQQAATENNLAQLHLSFGDTGRAIDEFQDAIRTAENAGDRNDVAITLASLGMAYHAQARETEAVETLQKAISLHGDLGDPHGAAVALNNLALVYKDTGEPQKALDTFETALGVFKNPTDPDLDEMATTLNNIGTVYRGLGAIDRARGYFNRARDLYRQTADEEGQATSFNNLGGLEQTAGTPEAALENYQQARSILERLGNRLKLAGLLSAMGIAHSQRNEPDQALQLLTEARTLAHQIGSPGDEALALHNLGTEYEKSGNLVQAMQALQQALPLWQQTHNAEFEAITHFVIARIALAQGDTGTALQQVDASIGLAESVRARVGSDTLRTAVFARAGDAYRLKIEIQMRAAMQHPGRGDAARAFETSERSRARGLLDLLAESAANIRAGLDPKLLADAQGIARSLNVKAAAQSKLPIGSPEYLELDRDIADLLTTYEQREAAIRAASPAFAALTQPVGPTLAQIQHLVDTDTMLLEFSIGDPHSYVWTITPGSFRAYELPARPILEAALREFKYALRARADAQRFAVAAADLGQVLLRPLAGELGHKRLIVVGDAALQAVPFGALTAPGARHPLVVDHEVVQEPSAASVDALRTALAGRKPKTGAVAVFADPVVGTDDPRLAHPDHDPPTHDSVAQVVLRGAEPGSGLQRLPETAEEAAAILALAPASSERARLGFAATKAAVQDPGLGDYRIVHFATHGLLDADHPELSGLVFSLFQPDGTGQDGYLRLTDVFNLSLPVDLAVLSACETGQGDLVGGEGVVGLTRGFFYAGAARLVVSLWKVDDAATKELMTQFYREMLGPAHLRPAAALRKAQLAMLDGRQWNHPFFWAPFIIQGEWR